MPDPNEGDRPNLGGKRRAEDAIVEIQREIDRFPEPAAPKPLTPVQQTVAVFIAVVVIAVVLALLLPPAMWAIRHGLIPLWEWGTRG